MLQAGGVTFFPLSDGYSQFKHSNRKLASGERNTTWPITRGGHLIRLHMRCQRSQRR